MSFYHFHMFQPGGGESQKTFLRKITEGYILFILKLCCVLSIDRLVKCVLTTGNERNL